VPDGLVAGIRDFLSAGGKITVLADSPIPLLVISWSGSLEGDPFESWLSYVEWHAIGPPRAGIGDCYKRCVSVDRLGDILSNGCDVIPTNAPIWAAQRMYKSLEYGGDSKVMMFFDPLCIQAHVKTSHDCRIIGDPWTALKGIFVMGANHDEVCRTTQNELERTGTLQWSLYGSGQIALD
jgi:hypothetical protein